MAESHSVSSSSQSHEGSNTEDEIDSSLHQHHDDSDENEEDNDDVIHLLLHRNDPHKDPLTMSLSTDEREWALEIRRAVQQSEEHDLVTDFECAQYAIFTQGDLPQALRRLQVVQRFERSHRVDRSETGMVTQGVDAIARFMKQQPGMLLALDLDAVTLGGNFAYDIGAFDVGRVLDATSPHGPEHHLENWLLGCYYMLKATQPFLAAIREGNFQMLDFGAMRWSSWNLSIHVRTSDEFFGGYPIKYRRVLCFNTGTIANISWSLLKHVYPSVTEVVQLGCKVAMEEDDFEAPKKLSDRFLRPSMEAAYEKILLRVKDLLTMRAKNEALFSLTEET